MGIKRRSSYYLIAAFLPAMISLATLPLITRFLGPVDYGLFALANAIGAFIGPLGTLGISFVVSNRLPVMSSAEQSRLISQLYVRSIALVAVPAAVVIAAVAFLHRELPVLEALPLEYLVLALVAVTVGMPWLVAGELLTLWGRARFYSLVSVLQVVTQASVTIYALYQLKLGTVALFLGFLASSGVSFISALIAVRGRLAIPRTLRLDKEINPATAPFLAQQVSEQGHVLVERFALSHFLGLAQLGLYSHSQRYRDIVLMGTKAISRGVWPVTLEEARSGGPFEATRRTWSSIHLLITLLGVAAVLFGDYFVRALTHDRFTSAAIYLGPWFIIVLLHFTSRAENGTAFALGEGRTVARLGLFANLSATLVLLILVPVVGVAGALAALATQGLVNRIGIRIVARRYLQIGFNDGWAVLGILVLSAVAWFKWTLHPEIGLNIAVLVATELGLLIIGRRLLILLLNDVLPKGWFLRMAGRGR